MKSPFPPALGALFAAVLPALGDPAVATLTLVEEAGFNEISIAAGAQGLSDSDTTTIAGNTQAELEIDPATGEVSEMTLSGGMFTGSDISLSAGSAILGFSVESEDLGGTITTPDPPGVVEAATGEFDASQYDFTIDTGTLDGAATVFFEETPISFDFSTEPAAGAGSGTGTVTLVETDRTTTSVSYEVIVVLPILIAQEVALIEGVNATVTAEGSVKAVGTTTIAITPANPYVAWTEANNIPGAPFEGDENGDRVPNGLQWALGLAASDSPFPHLLQPVGDNGTAIEFTVTLPEGGSAADLSVTTTTDPANTPFTPLASAAVSSGNPIPAGTTGTVTISLPKDPLAFVRLAVDAP